MIANEITKPIISEKNAENDFERISFNVQVSFASICSGEILIIAPSNFLNGTFPSESVCATCFEISLLLMPTMFVSKSGVALENFDIKPLHIAPSIPNQLFKRFVIGLARKIEMQKFTNVLKTESKEKISPFQKPIAMNTIKITIIPTSIQFITHLGFIYLHYIKYYIKSKVMKIQNPQNVCFLL